MTTGEAGQALRAYVEYLRDLGVYDLYRRGEPVYAEEAMVAAAAAEPAPQADAAHAEPPVVAQPAAAQPAGVALPPAAPSVPRSRDAAPAPASPPPARRDFLESPIPKLVSFNDLAPLPVDKLAAADKPAALQAIQEEIGDCTRCPLAYAGRRKIVFADGDPNARLMFVGEGPGADEDEQGLPFVGKAGQLLNNMITAMGVKREQVYIANIVKCRPPGNRTPEPVEATTCSQFLLRQMDVVQPEVVMALGSTAATYLLGVKQSLAGLRGKWHSCRGAKLVVT